MSIASPGGPRPVAVPVASHATIDIAEAHAEGHDQEPRVLLRRQPGAQGHQPVALRQQDDGLHRPVGLRQVDPAAHPEPHVRPLSRPARHRRSACSTATTCCAPARTSTCCAPASAWCSRSRRRFPMSIYENIAFGIRLYEKPAARRARRPRRAGAAPRRAVGRGQGQAQRQRPEPVGRPAAAPVHRPHRRGEAGGHPVRRALLGARSDLDRQDRGADRRAEAGLHDRHRHPQHAAGRARLGLHRLHVSRRADRVRRRPRRCSPRPRTSRTQAYITGRFG